MPKSDNVTRLHWTDGKTPWMSSSIHLSSPSRASMQIPTVPLAGSLNKFWGGAAESFEKITFIMTNTKQPNPSIPSIAIG